jgi:DNA end-binding protein Ku
VAVAKFILRTKENLAILKPAGDALVLNQIRFQSELREAENLNLPTSEEMNEKELDLALSLVDQLSEPFQPEKFHDTFTEELKQIIEQRAQGIDITAMATAQPQSTDDSNLLEALRASIEKSKTQVEA